MLMSATILSVGWIQTDIEVRSVLIMSLRGGMQEQIQSIQSFPVCLPATVWEHMQRTILRPNRMAMFYLTVQRI